MIGLLILILNNIMSRTALANFSADEMNFLNFVLIRAMIESISSQDIIKVSRFYLVEFCDFVAFFAT